MIITMAKLEIISSSSCPFAQRTRMVLLEKKVDFTLIEIPLDTKPDWFLKISPYGKVPVVRHGDTVVFESSVINEYLEEVFPNPSLLPKSPECRAQARIWIDFANVRFVPQIYKLLLAQEQKRQEVHAQKLTEALLMMEREALAKRSFGPYWLGSELTLIDFTFYPHLQRFCALEHYRNFNIPNECTLLKTWLAVIKDNSSVKSMAVSEDRLIRNWEKYALNTSTGTTAADMREV